MLGRAPLLQTLQRTAIMTSDKFKGVRLNLEPWPVACGQSNNAEQEEAIDELDIDYGGDAIEIGFNVTYLIDALTNMTQDMVRLELSDGNNSALITNPEDEHFKYVVMPCASDPARTLNPPPTRSGPKGSKRVWCLQGAQKPPRPTGFLT
jgi:DNA polymerase-3 subunit beta